MHVGLATLRPNIEQIERVLDVRGCVTDDEVGGHLHLIDVEGLDFVSRLGLFSAYGKVLPRERNL